MYKHKKSLITVLLAGVFMGAPCASAVETVAVELGSPDTTYIAVDFHDFVTKFDWSYGQKHPGLLKKLAQYGIVSGSLTALSYGFFGAQSMWLLLVPAIVGATFLARFAAFKYKKGRRPVVGQFVKDDPLLGYAYNEFVELESLFVPNEEVVGLLQELRDNGYSLVLASNIEPGSLKIMQERYPDLFKLFAHTVTPTKENGWLDKKQPEKYYQQLEDLLHESKLNKKQVIFIDDKERNCKKAEQVSERIKGISFNGSVAELRKKLREKNIKVMSAE